MQSTLCTETHVTISIGQSAVTLDRARAFLLAGRLQTRSNLTIGGEGGNLIYRASLLGGDTLSVAKSFLAHATVSIELGSLERRRLIKILRSV